MSNTLNEVTMNEHVFEIGRYAQQVLINDLGIFASDRFEYSEQERFELKGRIQKFTTQILESKLVEDSYTVYFNYKVPRSWWQHLKLDKAPKWFTNHYPIGYEQKRIKRTVNITRKATYPMADIVVPKNMGQVVIRDIAEPLAFYGEDDES